MLCAAIMILWLVALPGLITISCVSRIVNIMSLVVSATACLLILASLGSIYDSSVDSVKFRLRNMTSQYQYDITVPVWHHSTNMHNWRYWQQRFCNYGLYSSTAEVSGFLVYQLHTKGIVLFYWGSLRCVKIWIVIYCRGLKFPHTAVVLLVLESDGACTGLNGHCARKSAVLVLVWHHIARGDREQELRRY